PLWHSSSSNDLPLQLAIAIRFPKPQPAPIGVFIFTGFDPLRQLANPVNKPAAEHDAVGNKSRLEVLDAKEDFAFPSFCAESIQSRNTDKIFDNVAVAIRQVAELERKHMTLPNERGAEAGAEAEKQHASAAVAAERLHRSIVDDAHWFAERVAKIEPDPAFAEVLGVFHDLPATHRRRKSDRERVILPVARLFFHFLDESFRAQFCPGIEFRRV